MTIFAVSPYFGKTFGEFFLTLFHRLFLLLTGQLPYTQLASDEIQLFTLALIGISSTIIGAFLILREMTMLANALSHTILLGIVIAYLLMVLFFGSFPANELFISLKVLIFASLITAFLTTFFTELFTKVMRLQEDASIGLVFTSLFALGIVFVTLYTRNVHIGTEAIMGNIDALHLHDIQLSFYLALFNLVILYLFYRRLLITTFDTTLAKTFGISTLFFNYLLMLQTAATAIGAFRAVGVFLFLILLVGPPLIARLLTNRLSVLLLTAPLINLICALFAVAFSRHLLSVYQIPLSTSGLVVVTISCVYAATFFLCRGFKKIRAN